MLGGIKQKCNVSLAVYSIRRDPDTPVANLHEFSPWSKIFSQDFYIYLYYNDFHRLDMTIIHSI